MHIPIRLCVVLALTSVPAFGLEVVPLPKAAIVDSCLNFLRVLPLGNHPVERTMLRLNDVVRRTNRGILRSLPLARGEAGRTLDHHFTRALDDELNRLAIADRIELVGRILDYDDYDEPEALLHSGPRDTPLRVNGRFPRTASEQIDRKSLAELNSRELLDLTDGPGAWSAFRKTQTLRLLQILTDASEDHPEHLATIFAAAAIPLKFNVDLTHDVVFHHLGRMIGAAPIDVASKRRLIEREADVLRDVSRRNHTLLVNLSWGGSQSKEELAVAAFFKKILHAQGTLLRAAIAAFGAMSTAIDADNVRVLR